jgi:hypothetical protein
MSRNFISWFFPSSVCLAVGIASAADISAPPTRLAAVQAAAPTPMVAQRLREEMHQLLVRLSTSGALGAHPEQLAITVDEPAQRSVNLGLLVDATSASNARDGLRVLGATPGSTAEHLGVHPGDVVVAINGRSLRELGADNNGRALAASALKSSVDALPDNSSLQLDVLRGGNQLALNAPLQSVTLPALRLVLGGAAGAASTDADSSVTPSAAEGCGRINMMDLAPRQQHLYGATILLADGVTPGPQGAKTVRLDAGLHQLLVAERIPTLEMGMGDIASRRNSKPKPLTITLAANTTILVAARLNEDRNGHLNDGGYWDPVVWKEMAESCP